MKKLPVDIGKVADMMQSANYFENDFSAFLDTETGKIYFFTEDSVPSEVRDCEIEEEELPEILENVSEWQVDFTKKAYEIYCNDENGRYVSIPSSSSRYAYKRMREFVLNIEDEELRDKVFDLIQGKGAFTRFKTFLGLHREYLKPWKDYEQEFLREEATEWLNSIGIDPIDTPEYE
ncbi:MAG: UPF0158 family protein [Kosmotogaceae bacterium]